MASPPAGTVTSMFVPFTLTVCSVVSSFFTETVPPGLTVSFENANPEIVSGEPSAEPPPADGLLLDVDVDGGAEVETGVVDGLLEHAEATSAVSSRAAVLAGTLILIAPLRLMTLETASRAVRFSGT